MPKKKTGQRKKHEKNKERAKQLALVKSQLDYGIVPCNKLMDCDACGVQQKNRAFCYFCSALQKVIVCGHCGKTKCVNKHGDCVVSHGAKHVTGLNMVGAICDFCETWICHGLNCLGVHACNCPLKQAMCIECERDVNEHGGRLFQCAYCRYMLCEDDQFEHQASCQKLDAENFKCISCNRIGSHICLRCKVACCSEHSKRQLAKSLDSDSPLCPKCRSPMSEAYNLCISTRSYEYGRQRNIDNSPDEKSDYLSSAMNNVHIEEFDSNSPSESDTESNE